MSKIIDFTWNMERATFEMCGLDREKNFLEAPLCECECGCGGKVSLILESEEDVLNFCGAMAAENDCQQCGVFAITESNVLLFAMKFGEDVHLGKSNGPIESYTDIGKMADDFELHCYGLIVANESGNYKIVE